MKRTASNYSEVVVKLAGGVADQGGPGGDPGVRTPSSQNPATPLQVGPGFHK